MESIQTYQQTLDKNSNTSGQTIEKSKPSEKSKEPLAGLFKPAAGSWECKMCYIRNNADKTKCVACDTPAVEKKVETKPMTPVVQTPIVPGQKSLSELFKPAAGSWTCQGCYMVNKGTDQYCPACESPKDPSIPPKPKTNIFGSSADSTVSSTFTFGIPQTNKEAAPSAFSFSALSTTKPKGKLLFDFFENYFFFCMFLKNIRVATWPGK